MKILDLYKLPSNVLLCIGFVDIFRGAAHTFFLEWSATNIAKLNMASAGDQLFLMGAFGISNFLTGFLYLIISRKARTLSPYVLVLIPATYLFGLVGIWLNHVHGKSAFDGQYFMYVYFAICLITFFIFLAQKLRASRNF